VPIASCEVFVLAAATEQLFAGRSWPLIAHRRLEGSEARRVARREPHGTPSATWCVGGFDMKIRSSMLGISTAALLAVSATPALADQADKDACVGLEEDDDCTRGDGDPGFCIPDESDPNVLTCDDDTAGAGGDDGSGGDDSSGSGCSASGGAGSSLAGGGLIAGLIALARRRRATRPRA
jgi:uncharacterized protein (TIGR03382 family)